MRAQHISYGIVVWYMNFFCYLNSMNKHFLCYIFDRVCSAQRHKEWLALAKIAVCHNTLDRLVRLFGCNIRYCHCGRLMEATMSFCFLEFGRIVLILSCAYYWYIGVGRFWSYCDYYFAALSKPCVRVSLTIRHVRLHHSKR